MKRLELANGRMLPKGAYRVWWDQIKRRSYTKEAIENAVNDLIESKNAFPRLSDIISSCGAERKADQDQVRHTQQQENARREEAEWKKNANKFGKQIAKDSLTLIQKLYSGVVSIGDGFYKGMLELHDEYPNAGFKGQAEVYINQHHKDKTRTVIGEPVDTRSLSEKISDTHQEEDVPF